MSRQRPTLAVVYDEGAASAGEIGLGLADLGRVVFLVPDTSHTELMRPVMESLGEVLSLTGSAQHDIDLARQLSPNAILTFSERMIRKTAELAEALGLLFHSPETARILTDKVRQRQVLREAGVDDVRSHPLRSLAEWPSAVAAVTLPAVIKPVQGGGSRDTYAVASEAEAEELLPRLFAAREDAGMGAPEFTVEELLQGRPTYPFGDYVSVESACTRRGISHLAVTGKFPLLKPFREPGRFWPTHVSPGEKQQILDLTTRALTALQVTNGLTHTELKLTAAGPRIIEVNGRLTGHMNLTTRSACGIDLVHLAGLLALGEEPDVQPLDFGGKVHFQFNNMAPTEPCRLERVHGAGEVRRVSGVTGYRNYIRTGHEIPGGVMTYPVDVIWGECDDHLSVIETVEKALSVLSYEFRFADGTRRVPASFLQRQP